MPIYLVCITSHLVLSLIIIIFFLLILAKYVEKKSTFLICNKNLIQNICFLR
jgi:hypothetical protein